MISGKPGLVQGVGAQMSGLIETEPIITMTAGIEAREGGVIDKEKAGIDQVKVL